LKVVTPEFTGRRAPFPADPVEPVVRPSFPLSAAKPKNIVTSPQDYLFVLLILATTKPAMPVPKRRRDGGKGTGD
jgi:hypothetical protein